MSQEISTFKPNMNKTKPERGNVCPNVSFEDTCNLLLKRSQVWMYTLTTRVSLNGFPSMFL